MSDPDIETDNAILVPPTGGESRMYAEACVSRARQLLEERPALRRSLREALA